MESGIEAAWLKVTRLTSDIPILYTQKEGGKMKGKYISIIKLQN